MIDHRFTIKSHQDDIRTFPGNYWNELLGVVSSPYDELTTVQRVGHLAYWYDAELQNGGHLQYFLNDAGKMATETVDALNELGAQEQFEILSTALELWKSKPRSEPASIEEYVSEVLEEEFSSLDQNYYSCERPIVTEILEQYMLNNLDEFVVFE